MSQEKPEPQYFSRSEFIAALEENIEQLQRILTRVNRESIDTWPESSILEDLQQTTRELNHSLVTTPLQAEVKPEPELGLDGVLPSFNSLESWWDRILAFVRSLLPLQLREQVQDWMITGILTGTLVALLLGVVLLISPLSPQQVQEVSSSPDLTLDNPLDLNAPENPETLVLKAEPEPVLTPEQKLVAALQEALDSLIGEYSQEIVTGIVADFDTSHLVVTIGEGWSALNPKEQDNLANDIWQRSQHLDFKTMEIVNSQKELIARSPVIGEQVIILQRIF